MIASMETNITLLTKLTESEVKKIHIDETMTGAQYGNGCRPPPYQYQPFQEPPSMQFEYANYVDNSSGGYRPQYQQATSLLRIKGNGDLNHKVKVKYAKDRASNENAQEIRKLGMSFEEEA
ncbi:hypothetical protein HAX54_045122 [Datura stramonium]|uniref:Uncharacterized protein n=1 Tax=Datura stramonium TaxID=4076 RepID=A0ABS8SQG7_DATST|nr:hypothetical protein [Datura stramonium]